MPPDLSVVEGAYLRDILDQPRALEATSDALEISESLQRLVTLLQQGRFKSVILTGMGASFHALHPLNLELIDHGLVAVMVETSELVHYQSRLFNPARLIIAVSQSGRSAEIVRLLESNQGQSPVIAITNTADSPLAEQANTVVLTRAGQEFSVSCKTYVTGLLALRWLGDVLCGRDGEETKHQLSTDIPAVKNYLAHWKEHVLNMGQLLKHVRDLFLVGRGASLAAVGTGALIIKESTHFHAEGMSSAAFRHGPFEMLGENTFVMVFAGDDKTRGLNLGLLKDIREKHGRTELVGEDSSFSATALSAHSPAMRAILEILPVQMLTLALAAQAQREPGRFELAYKVTTKE